MRIEYFVIVLLSFTIAACVPGTVEHGDNPGWTPAENDPQSAEDDSQDPPGDGESPSDTPQTPIGDDPNAEPTDVGPECSNGQDMCASVCVDLTTDSAHCGACDNACPSGSSCTAAACTCDAAGEDLCGGSCVDTTSSTLHCGGCDMPCSGGMICASGQCVGSAEIAGVLEETNAVRAAGANCGAYGVKEPTEPLQGDPELHEAAQAHADDMSANNFFSHTGSDGSSFSDRIRRTNFSGAPVGENIAAGQRSPQSVVSGWVDSDGHCRNLMNPGATKIGIGYATGGPYGTLWVQVFAR